MRTDDIAYIVNPTVEACCSAINAAVRDNPNRRPNAIRMTVLDVVAASVIRTVAQDNPAGLSAPEIIQRHARHIADFLATEDMP